MKEVSCALSDFFFRKLPAGHDPAELVAGTGYTVEHLRKKNERIDWNAFAVLMKNAGRIWNESELEALGRVVFDTPYLRPFLVMSRLLFDAMGLYKFAFTSSRGLGNQLITCITPSLEVLASDRIRVQMVLHEGCTFSPEYFHVCKGSLEGMPTALGLAPARIIKMEWLEAGARYEVGVPPGGAVLWRLKKALEWPFVARAAARELRESNEALTLRYHDLEQARTELAAKAEEIRTVETLGRELARSTDLKELAGALVHLIHDRLGYRKADVWLASRTSGAMELLHARGLDAPDEPRRLELLSGAGELLGVVNVWGNPTRGASTELLGSLVPWFVIAFENARSFSLLKEAQDLLERRVEERTQQLQDSLQKITEADRAKTEFFANASHELRTPLTLLLAPLESLLQRDDIAPSAKHELSELLRNGYRLLKLINDLLDLSKLEAGKMTVKLSRIDLVPLLEQSMRSWGSSLKQRKVSVEFDVPPILPLVGDPERLDQVVLNLATNAVKYVDDGGKIWIRARTVASNIEFSVENTGGGIAEEDLPKLFDRFAQSTKSKKRRFGSTGLGLPLVKELVELHGGTISVVNRPGETVAFIVTIPIGDLSGKDAGTAEHVVPSAEELMQYAMDVRTDAPSNTSVLVDPASEASSDVDLPLLLLVEDNTSLREFLVRLLKNEYTILEANDGLQGLKLAHERLPDIILSDLMMPEMDGNELCRALKDNADTASIPFILLSARAELATKLSGLGVGADDYLVKPFHPEELRARLRKQLQVRTLLQRLSHNEKLAALGTVVAGVAHEVRNPLSGMAHASC